MICPSRLFMAAAFVLAFPARATEAPPMPSGPAIARAGGGQGMLAVGFDGAGILRSRVCATGAVCSIEGAPEIPTKVPLGPGAGRARLTIARLGLDRRAVVVEVPLSSGGGSFAAIVAAPLQGTEPLVLWSGETGQKAGIEGERSGEVVVVRPEGIYVGSEREGRDLCGRPALLAPRAVDPRTLTLRPAKLQRLTDAERERAGKVVATPAGGATAPVPLLSAVWATSARDGYSPRSLTDGDPATPWVEDRGGAGRGELIVLRAPREVPLGAFDLTLAGAPVAAPTTLWLATDGELFHVTIPPAKGPPPGETLRFSVPLPAPVRTSCVALVLEESAGKGDHDVGVAELAARPVMAGDNEALVRALGGGGPEAEVAGALLGASGPEAHAAVRDAFAALDEGGRRVALGVLDHADCATALPAYVAALAGASDAHRAHARSALRRCPGQAVAREVGRALEGTSDPRSLSLLVDELSELAPAEAVGIVVPRLAAPSSAERRVYRAAIARAMASTEAAGKVAEALREAVGNPGGQAIGLEILRALGPHSAALGPEAELAFAQLAREDAPFRTRYLLLGIAAELARKSGSARTFLRRAVSADASSEIRAEAARLVPDPKAMVRELQQVLGSGEVRVREAAAETLGRGRVDAAAPALLHALENDPWPRVRQAAAAALGKLGPGAATDATLLSALGDEAKGVRRSALAALGARRVVTAEDEVRALLEDAEEDATVRGAAATALGGLCARGAVTELTRHAQRLSRFPVTEEELLIGGSALRALAHIGPADLKARLAPLAGKGVAPAVRQLADAALRAPAACAAGGRTP